MPAAQPHGLADRVPARRVEPGQGAVGFAGHPDRVGGGGDPQRRGANRDRLGDVDPAAAEQGRGQRRQPGGRRRRGAGPLQPPPAQRPEAPAAAADRLRRPLRRVREHPRRRQAGALALAGGGDQRPGARVAPARVTVDGPLDHRVKPLRDLRLGVGVLAGVGDDPGQRLVEDAAERVDVGGGADRAAAPLLRRHVLGGADDRGAAEHAAVAERLGEAEVGEEGAVAFDQDVVRLDVAVDDAGGVGGVERFGDLAEQGDGAGRRQRPVAVDRPPQVAALDQAHRDDQLAVDLARVEDRHHRRMVEAGGEPGLAQEALAEAVAAGQLAGDHLQRHRPFEARGGWPGRRRPSRRGRSARRGDTRRASSRWRVLPPARYTRLGRIPAVGPQPPGIRP